MRIAPLVISALLLLGLIRLLDQPLLIGDVSLPPLGPFFNPNTGFWRNAERPGLQAKTNVKIPGMKGAAQAHYDDMLVPHIFADNIEDAFRAQGYITASLRLWQMDITSRQTAGRLSEVFGERTLEVDRIARRRGLLLAAENDWLPGVRTRAAKPCSKPMRKASTPTSPNSNRLLTLSSTNCSTTPPNPGRPSKRRSSSRI